MPSYQFILADEELAGLVGNSDAAKGKELLLEMKKVKALDQIVENGRIQQDEFDRLFDVGVLAAAAEALAAAATATPAASDAAPPMRQRHQRRTRWRHRQQTQPQPHLLRLRRLQHPSKQWLGRKRGSALGGVCAVFVCDMGDGCG